jgi:hypothetical protein
MHPQIHVNVLAVLAAVVASFIFGWLWHGPVFGKVWMRLMNMSENFRPQASEMVKSIIIGLVGTVLMAYVLVHSTLVWRPSVWGLSGDQAPYVYGFFSGFFVWLGYIVPVLLNKVAWERRSWKLFGFSATYQFFNLQLLAMIIAYLN